ncbi:MAG: adenylate/guanylate cyclase domain-containing protein, partial [Gemmatimonadales bacterium]
LRELTDDDLKEMGLPLGPRVKLRKAIQALAETSAEAEGALPEPERESVPHGEAERRQLTVMFVDMVGSTRLSAELDPEDMRQLLLDYQGAVSEAVAKYGGHIARYFGDGVLCYFGWPRAHEKSAEESVRAGLAATDAVARLKTSTNEPLAARVGIATGLVVVGDIVGEGSAEEEAVVGETPNLAARLQALAEPGQVVVSETTRRLVQEVFDVTSLGGVELKGFGSEVEAFAVTEEKAPSVQFEAGGSGHLTELVGREHELGMIQDRWERAMAGEGQAVLLLGEAGIGKSRIVKAFCDSLRGVKHYRFRQRWTPFHILGVDASKRYGHHGLTSEQLRHETLHALADEAVSIARRRPLCVILEDAHWMDASSIELVRLTFEKLRTERILALLPARPEIDPSFANHPALTRISLNRLGTREVHRIIRSVAGGKALPPALVDDITSKTDGVPLFVEEVTKSVLESEHVTETEDAYELTVPVDSLQVPATLQDSLMARLDRQPSAKEVAQVAACLGREFDTEALRAITGFGEGVVMGALEQLREVDVISRRGGSAHNYRFRHALLCDAAYQSLLKAKRRQIHGRIVELLESRGSSEPEIVAQHAYQAGLIDKAVEKLRDSALRDLSQSAYTEAAAHAAKGVRWLREEPDSPERAVREARLQTLAAFALIPTEGYSSIRTANAFDEAVRLALKTDDIRTSVLTLTGKALVNMTQGDRPALVSSTEELWRISCEGGHDFIRFYGAMMKGYTHLLVLELDEGRRLVAEAQSLFVDEHERRGQRAGYPMWDSLRWWEQMGAWLAGDASYESEISECLELARLGEHDTDRAPFVRCWCPTFYSFLALAEEDLDLAAALAERALALATEHDIRSYEGWSRSVLAIHEAAHGDVDRALERFAEAGAQAAEVRFGWGLPTFRAELAKALLSRGRVEEAKEFSRNAKEALAQTKELWWEPEVLRVHGDVCLAEGNRDGAAAGYQKAIEVAKRQGASAWERRAQASLAALQAS